MRKPVIYGYARVSTAKQKLSRQIDNIKRYAPNAVIIEESFTGTTVNRPKWNSLRKNLKPGDTIIFDEVSRMSRNAEEGFELYKELYAEDISLIFLKEPHINTSTYKEALQRRIGMTGGDVDVILKGINEYLMILAKKQIELAFQTAQKEVDFLHQRTSEGVRRAQAEGKQVGRKEGTTIETQKSKKTKELILMYSKNFNGMLKDKDVMKLAGVCAHSYYKYKKELREQESMHGTSI